MDDKLGQIYFGALGIAALILGIADFVCGAVGSAPEWGILVIPGDDPFRGLWGGLIVIFAGLFYLSGVKNISKLSQFSRIVMGSILVWIVVGCDIFAMITGSIPGEETWFNSFGNFIGAYAPPYPPAIFLLPFSLLVFYCIREWRIE